MISVMEIATLGVNFQTTYMVVEPLKVEEAVMFLNRTYKFWLVHN